MDHPAQESRVPAHGLLMPIPSSLRLVLARLAAVWMLLYGTVGHTASDGREAESREGGFAARQQACLEQIAAIESLTPLEKGIALLFLEKRVEEANRLLLTLDISDVSLINGLTLLRALFADASKPDLLHPESRQHLLDLLKQYLADGAELLMEEDAQNAVPESQRILAPTILYLWGIGLEPWGVEWTWPDKKPNTEHVEQMQKRLHGVLDHWSKYSLVERGSPYTYPILAALMNLYDYAADPAMQQKAAAVTDMIVADIALENLGGLWGGARHGAFEAIKPIQGNRLPFLLFGDRIPSMQGSEVEPNTFILCHSQYRPPQVLEEIGYQRKLRGIYEIKQKFCVDVEMPDTSGVGRKYSYVTPRYILGSFQLRRGVAPWQSRPWDLLIWDEEQMENHLFTFTGSQLYSGGEPPFTKSYYTWDATCFQYKNVLFCQFHQSDKQFIDEQEIESLRVAHYEQLPQRIWVPNALSPVELEKDWWFARMSGVYVAFRPIRGTGYWWRTAEMDEAGNSTASIMTCQNLFTPFVIEVELENRFSSFNQFKQQVLEAPLIVDDQSITFVSRRGDVFLFPLKGGDFLVNGRPIDPWNDPEYDLYSSPYVQSRYGSGYFTAKWAPYSLVLDLRDSKSPVRHVNVDCP